MPSSTTSLVRPTASRSSGDTSTRPVASMSTSMALPRKMRFHHCADMGSCAIRSRNCSHSVRGNSIRQPWGCLVRVTWPWAMATRASRCRVGTDSRPDRKSTRLNSSHLVISYAVFCLKKKKKTHESVSNLELPLALDLYPLHPCAVLLVLCLNSVVQNYAEHETFIESTRQVHPQSSTT